MFKRRIRDAASGPATFVTPPTTIVGTITGAGAFVFCGTVEGDCEIDGTVTLARGAQWRGTLAATDVIVAGMVEGDIRARQRVEVVGTARVTGRIVGHSIAIAEGAVIDGEIQVASGEGPLKFHEKREA